jgi:hypothetical protein
LFEDFQRNQFPILWRGTRDGFHSWDFHSLVDKITIRVGSRISAVDEVRVISSQLLNQRNAPFVLVGGAIAIAQVEEKPWT